ncbi:hypothetical protein ABEQ93_12345 [Cutibacterium acnes]
MTNQTPKVLNLSELRLEILRKQRERAKQIHNVASKFDGLESWDLAGVSDFDTDYGRQGTLECLRITEDELAEQLARPENQSDERLAKMRLLLQKCRPET